MLRAARAFGYRPYAGEVIEALSDGEVAMLVAFLEQEDRMKRTASA